MITATAASAAAEEDVGQIYSSTPKEVNIVTDEATGIKFVNNELLVTSEEGVAYETIQQLAAELGGEIVGWIEKMEDYQIRLNTTYTKAGLEALIAQVESNPNVHDVWLNYAMDLSPTAITIGDCLIPVDPWGGGQNWNTDLPEGNNWGVEAIRAPQAWFYRNEMSPIKIGLIDSGFDVVIDPKDPKKNTGHEDLKNVFTWVHKNNEPSAHGTHVAGTMAAEWDNGKGISGVMPTKKSNGERLVDLLGVPAGKGGENWFTFEMKSTFAELILRNTKVINMSIGLKFPSRNVADEWSLPETDFMKRALKKGFDFLLVCAAGNDGIDAEIASPMNAIKDAEVKDRIVVVGAIAIGYEICNFSNLGGRIDVMAPGSKIYSTVPGNEYENEYKDIDQNGNVITKLWSGTSMAAPHVAGVAAMVWAINPNLTGALVKSIVCGTADIYVDGQYWCVNAEAAVHTALTSRKYSLPSQQNPQNGAVVGRVAVVRSNALERATLPAYLKGASITVRTSAGVDAGSATTDVSGQFKLILPAGTYTLCAEAEGYTSGVIENVTIENGEVKYLEWFKLYRDFGTGTGTGTAKGTIRDVVNGSVLPSVSISFKNLVTNELSSTTTASNGQYSVTLPVGHYEATLTKSGYVSTTFTVAVAISPNTTNLSQDATMTSIGGDGEYETHIVYASRVVEFIPGDPWTSDTTAQDPKAALGAPNYDHNGDGSDVTLGYGGSLVLGFEHPFGDAEGDDIYVYETFEAEPYKVEISNDLANWILIGTSAGQNQSFDIKGKVNPNCSFQYVKITDGAAGKSGTWPGADIDAVGVRVRLPGGNGGKRQTYNGHTYQVFDTSITWHEAKTYCEDLGGHLATITSAYEQQFIESLLVDALKKVFWLGATDEKTEGTWEWVTGESFAYTNWRQSQPDNADNLEHYLMLYREEFPLGGYYGKWNDIAQDEYGARE